MIDPIRLSLEVECAVDLAHRDSGAPDPLVFVGDGFEALEYLRRTGRHAVRSGSPRIGIILLDLNMPGMDGRENLQMIRADPTLRRVPVVILTTSAADTDVAMCYDLGANSYIIKPSSYASLVHMFKHLSSFWFEVSSLAPEVTR